jgi:heterodisulfide reductase subunit D
MDIESIFWASQIILVVVFSMGMANVILMWRKGVQDSDFIPSGKWKTFLLSWGTEGWFNRRLFRTNIWRWASHFLMVNGFLLLIALSAFSVLFDKILPLIPGLDPNKLKSIVDRDQPIKALLNETGSLMMTLGWLFYAIRRFLIKPAQLRTSIRDQLPLIGLGIILITGWMVEAIRINAEQTNSPFSFIGSPLAQIISGLPISWAGSFKSFFLIHGLLATLVLATIPYSKWMHTFAASITTGLYSIRPQSVYSALPFTIRQRIELDACTRCGDCISWCPTYKEKPASEAITPLKKIEFNLQDTILQQGFLGWGGQKTAEPSWQEYCGGVFDCTLCGRCAVVCPVHIQTRDLWLSMRAELINNGRVPPAISRLESVLSRTHNLAGDESNDRLAWSQNLEKSIPLALSRESPDILFFVGCVGSQYPKTFTIPQSIVSILEQTRMKYGILGDEEWCCGFPLLAAGLGAEATTLARHNLEAVQKTGAKILITGCPSCYRMWKEEYPALLGMQFDFEILHSTALLEDLVLNGQIQFKPFDHVLTYHDPCDLGRGCGMYETPRNVLRAMTGVKLVEMPHNREYALCCGGGGDVEMIDEELSAKIAHHRIEEAVSTGADLVVTACQQCVRSLSSAAKSSKSGIRVEDITSLVARQLL